MICKEKKRYGLTKSLQNIIMNMGDHMNIFDEIVISKIAVIVRVEPGMAQLVHTNRRFYGLVCNESGRKDYLFDDGTVLHTQAGDVYFLPKHSNYRVVNIEDGACWAVNFEVCQPLNCLPFLLHLPQMEEWFRQMLRYYHEGRRAELHRCFYEVVCRIVREQQRRYMPSRTESLLAPALAYIEKNLTDPNLSVKTLVAVCGISEAYLRRLFTDRFGMSPKAYIINRRLTYASQLLESTQFTVSEIARMCGYGEPCHFSREFKRHYGYSPGQRIST